MNTSNSKIIQSYFFFKTTDDLLRLLLNESPNSLSGREIKSENKISIYTEKMINVASSNEYSFYVILFIFFNSNIFFIYEQN
jgi:hypothetical protein